MVTQQIDRTKLKNYFDRIGKTLGTQQVEIEVASLDIGDQIEAHWIGLTNISYDPNSDTIDIGTPRLDHRISHPAAIYIREDAGEITAIDIERHDGTQEIVKFRRPLAIPAPAA